MALYRVTLEWPRPPHPSSPTHLKRAEGASVISHEAHDEHHQGSPRAQHHQQQISGNLPAETNDGGRGQLRRALRLDSCSLQVRGRDTVAGGRPAGEGTGRGCPLPPYIGGNSGTRCPMFFSTRVFAEEAAAAAAARNIVHGSRKVYADHTARPHLQCGWYSRNPRRDPLPAPR